MKNELSDIINRNNEISNDIYEDENGKSYRVTRRISGTNCMLEPGETVLDYGFREDTPVVTEKIEISNDNKVINFVADDLENENFKLNSKSYTHEEIIKLFDVNGNVFDANEQITNILNDIKRLEAEIKVKKVTFIQKLLKRKIIIEENNLLTNPELRTIDSKISCRIKYTGNYIIEGVILTSEENKKLNEFRNTPSKSIPLSLDKKKKVDNNIIN
jgi:hypothetical protein